MNRSTGQASDLCTMGSTPTQIASSNLSPLGSLDKTSPAITSQNSQGQGSITAVEGSTVGKAGLSVRHTYSMALTGAIGTGLWFATAPSLYYGGPMGLIFGFGLVGTMVYFVMAAMTEMISLNPHENGFFGYVREFLGDGINFACCYNYLLLWLFCLPAEIVASVELLQMLWPSVPVAGAIAVLLVLCVGIQAMPSRVYGESEFIFAVTKFLGLVIAVITIIMMDAGGFSAYRPNQNLNWEVERLWGIGGLGPLRVILGAGFAMGGIELFTLGVLDTEDPRHAAKNNIKAILARQLFCYMFTITLFTTAIYSGTDSLTGVTSPIIEALRLAHQDALKTTIVVAVLCCLVSMANSATYVIKQSIRRTARFGYLPVPKKYHHHFTNRLCWPSFVVSIAFGSIAFMKVSPSGARTFEYLTGVAAMGNYITWSCMLAAYWRFRQALAVYQKSDNTNAGILLPYTSIGPAWIRNLFVAGVLTLAFSTSHILAIHPLGTDTFTALKFLCKTGVKYAFILVAIMRVLYMRFRFDQGFSKIFPTVSALQPVVHNYLETYRVHRTAHDEESQETATK